MWNIKSRKHHHVLWLRGTDGQETCLLRLARRHLRPSLRESSILGTFSPLILPSSPSAIRLAVACVRLTAEAESRGGGLPPLSTTLIRKTSHPHTGTHEKTQGIPPISPPPLLSTHVMLYIIFLFWGKLFTTQSGLNARQHCRADLHCHTFYAKRSFRNVTCHKQISHHRVINRAVSGLAQMQLYLCRVRGSTRTYSCSVQTLKVRFHYLSMCGSRTGKKGAPSGLKAL